MIRLARHEIYNYLDSFLCLLNSNNDAAKVIVPNTVVA
ncbi:hypothetical protein SEVCU116_0244 [Staphylococcus capitis VCU116]|nr:hypothetical protein SEVCU116_0244 [Staphylococcus capitis VCU116]